MNIVDSHCEACDSRAASLASTSEDSTVESSSATTGGSGDAATSGDDGLLSGNQLIADVLAPVTVGGNAHDIPDLLVRAV